jgi:SNF2-related domain/Helicase conserved C-terminal domain
MQRVALRDVDLASFRAAIGPEGCADATAAVQRGAVLQMAWEAAQQLLTGTVREHAGQDGAGRSRAGEIRTVSASFRASPGFPLRFRVGYCSCAQGTNCAHVAALVLAATDETLLPATTAAEAAARRSALPWEQSLDSLLAAPQAPAPAPSGDVAAAAPLAVELSLVQHTTEPFRFPSYATDNGRHEPTVEDPTRKLKLQARLVQPGRLGGWVAGNLSWSRLDYLLVRDEVPADQIRLLHELYALHRSGGSSALHAAYFQRYAAPGRGDQKYLDLSACDSRQLWPVLEQAHAAGLPFVYPGKLGNVPPPGSAELRLDVTTEGTTLLIAPSIKTADGADAVPLRFIGTDGHGVVYADRAQGNQGEATRFKLARLAHPVPAQLQLLALGDERLVVPEAGQEAFLSRYYPRLRRQATVTSSDGSFTAPEISGPTLVVQAGYAHGHHLSLRWEWAYQVGGSELRAPLGAARDPFRDPEAEARVLARIGLPAGVPGVPPELGGPGGEAADRGLLADYAGRPPRGDGGQEPPIRGPVGRPAGGLAPRENTVTLHGFDAMAFTTEVLPLLQRRRDVRVEVTGAVPDYHEAGDSLEIGLSTGELAGDRDWFDLGITVTVEGAEVPFADLFVALAHNQSHLLLPDGAYFSLDKPELAALSRLIDEARALQDQPDGSLRISRFQAGLWEELTALGVVGHQAAAWQQQVQGLLSAGDIEAVPVPAAINAQLRPYQVSGFQWLAFLWSHGLGGILADDMGLGKTLQTLALLQHAKDVQARGETPLVRNPPFLIVAPTSVLANWAAEAHRFAPDLKVVTVSDTIGRRGGTLADVTDGADAVVTSYTLLRLDFEAFGAREWSGLILDEAQYVKNHQSKAYQCARRLAAPFKVAITGTPMENNLMELWSLLSIAAPGVFPNPERFRDYYAKPIEKFGNSELLTQLRRRIRPLIMRRTKEQVAADLPEKQEQVLEVELDPRHRRVYQTHLQRERQKILGLLDDVNHNRFTILRSLTLLRQLSLSAALVDPEYADVPSAKIDSLLEQIADVAGGGHRALVFSQFTRFLRMARSRLEASGVECCYLDGSTTNRPAVISSFKEGTAPVFLISLKAGGFGLNLTEADYCFLLDPWWNPATEAQAVDRTHRIGQTRNVMVYRLIAAGTIEEKVMALKARKAELFSSVIDSDGAFSSALSADDIRALFA